MPRCHQVDRPAKRWGARRGVKQGSLSDVCLQMCSGLSVSFGHWAGTGLGGWQALWFL